LWNMDLRAPSPLLRGAEKRGRRREFQVERALWSQRRNPPRRPAVLLLTLAAAPQAPERPELPRSAVLASLEGVDGRDLLASPGEQRSADQSK